MSLLFLEGFGSCATGEHVFAAGDDLAVNWSSMTSPNIGALTSGSQGEKKYLYDAGSGTQAIRSKTWSALTTFVWGGRLKVTSLNNGVRVVNFCNPNGLCGHLSVLPGGQVAYGRNQYGYVTTTYLNAYSSKSIPIGVWVYLEVKVVMSNTVGTVDMYLNGEQVCAATGLDTIDDPSLSSITHIALNLQASGGSASANQLYWTDIYVDTDTVHGPMDVWYQPCDTAGSASNFTPLSSTNESQVDEIGNDGDTTYNSSTSTGTLDQIAHSDALNADPVAIQPIAMARYVPTGSANFKLGVLSGTTHDQAAAVGLADTYDGYRGTIYETDPNTAAAWTAANADAAETTYEHAA